MMEWYLVSIFTGAFVGPLDSMSCQNAARFTSPTVVCERAIAMTSCPVPDHPEVFIACPVFPERPQITVKPR